MLRDMIPFCLILLGWRWMINLNRLDLETLREKPPIIFNFSYSPPQGRAAAFPYQSSYMPHSMVSLRCYCISGWMRGDVLYGVFMISLVNDTYGDDPVPEKQSH